jgi:predicted signal transduction protein with EAL and GGDEF domain
LQEPHHFEGRRIIISASIGAAIAPADGTTAHELMAYADGAMYAAKYEKKKDYRLAPELIDVMFNVPDSSPVD